MHAAKDNAYVTWKFKKNNHKFKLSLRNTILLVISSNKIILSKRAKAVWQPNRILMNLSVWALIASESE